MAFAVDALDHRHTSSRPKPHATVLRSSCAITARQHRVAGYAVVSVVVAVVTFERMAETARFIARNLPFVNQVALMGLEMTGFTKSNLEALWIDPPVYQAQLGQAVR